MKKFTPYKLKTLPKKGYDENGLYFIKGETENTFKVYLRDEENKTWIKLEQPGEIAAVIRFNLKEG